jgi:Flp pilus assembly protein TadD
MVDIADAMRLATEHFHGGRLQEAEALGIGVLAVDADNSEALHLCGVLAHLRGNQGMALALLEKAVRLAPASAQFRYNLGVVYGVLQRVEEAAAEYRAALALEPKHGAALNNLGNAALDLGEFAEARRCYESALAQNPGDARLTLALAITLYNQRELDAADRLYRQALEIAPEDARAHWEYAHLLLLRGDFARGWPEYEWRFRAGRDSQVYGYPFAFPRWAGEPLAGRTLLVHGEQGLGDEIMFASIYPELIAEAGRCVIACQPHLAPLFAASFPKASVHAQLRADADQWTRQPVPWLEAAGPIDFQVPAGSLPGLRRRALKAFPRGAGYLKPPADKVARFAEQLAGEKRPRVGVAWQANPALAYGGGAQRRARDKSIATQVLRDVLPARGARYISLQKDAPMAPGVDLLDLGSELEDFSGTAALVANLDAVVSIDTSVAHLAGAMNVPVAILLRHEADWRWQLDAETTPWYPSAHLLRQRARGEWAALREPLTRWLKSCGGKRPPSS